MCWIEMLYKQIRKALSSICLEFHQQLAHYTSYLEVHPAEAEGYGTMMQLCSKMTLVDSSKLKAK